MGCRSFVGIDEIVTGTVVTFAIVQTPKSKMTDQYSQQALEQIQARCHAANHAISQRYLNKPNLDMIVALVT